MVKVTQKNFDQFLQNQAEFAKALNHRMSNIEIRAERIDTNIIWIKKLVFTGVGILAAVFIAVVMVGI
ncbi:MAG: hypothetical protein AAB875_06560 [Patescibacteria group bacterium]